jgi:lipase ATG15
MNHSSQKQNIIPERDIVPMIDDPAQNFQEIRCLAEHQDIIGCHNSDRSLCEILFTCGSNNRPIPCGCVTVFGYPEPIPKEGTNVTFLEACRLREEEMANNTDR